MPPVLHFPDLRPPEGWSYLPVGSQIHLLPPGARPDSEPARIVLSPLVARHDRLPPPERLIEMALELEAEARFTITDRGTPAPLTTPAGLSGVSLEVRGYCRPDGAPERRLYVLLADPLCYYGANYIADEKAFPEQVESFWALVRSLRPFSGEALVPPAAGGGPSPMGNYVD
jgi:hypothetical protein